MCLVPDRLCHICIGDLHTCPRLPTSAQREWPCRILDGDLTFAAYAKHSSQACVLSPLDVMNRCLWLGMQEKGFGNNVYSSDM